MVNDSSCPHAVIFLSGRIRSCQKSLYRMHIRVQSPIRIQLRKFCIPGVCRESEFLVPEVLVIYRRSLFKQLLRRGSSRKHSAGCRKNHEGMCIALLRSHGLSIRRHSRIPAVVFLIMQFSEKALQTCICKLFASRVSQKSSKAVHMHHTCGNPGLAIPILPRCAVISKPVGAALRRWKLMSECQEILPCLLQKCPVFFCANLIFPVHLSSASPLRSKSYPLRISASARLLCLSPLLHTSPGFTIV